VELYSFPTAATVWSLVTNNGTAGGDGVATEAATGNIPDEEMKSEEEKANRPKRALKPNVKLSGPEWVRG
jgi:hypothetical protein